MMLRRKNKIFKSAVNSFFSPHIGIKTHGIELPDQIDIPLFKRFIILCPIDVRSAPLVTVLIAERPRLADTADRIKTEVHHKREFLIHKPFETLFNYGIGRVNIAFRRITVNTVDDTVLGYSADYAAADHQCS